MVTAYWTYDTFDGRWLKLPLPEYREIESIHGTFGLYTLIIFPVFAIYAFRRGNKRLIQSDSLNKLTQFGKPIWWYSLHRLVNTLILFALTFALYSGRMMDSKWLPEGELNHFWYYAHLLSWLIMAVCLILHLLMTAKVGGVPLLLSILADIDNLKKNLGQADNEIQGFGGKLEKFGKVAAAAFAAATVAAVAIAPGRPLDASKHRRLSWAARCLGSPGCEWAEVGVEHIMGAAPRLVRSRRR